MDVVTCEAPLDNSFQKDRRELVNKGSLGRRRKPSRSNLKLILSPNSDQQDTLFNGQLFNAQHKNQQQNGHIEDFAQSCNGEALRQEEATSRGNDNLRRNSRIVDPQLQVAANNYKNVIASITELQRTNGEANDSSGVNNVVESDCHKTYDKRNSVHEVISKDCDLYKVNGVVKNDCHKANGKRGGIHDVISKEFGLHKVSDVGKIVQNINNKVIDIRRSSCEDFNGNCYNRFSTSNGYRTEVPTGNSQLDKSPRVNHQLSQPLTSNLKLNKSTTVNHRLDKSPTGYQPLDQSLSGNYCFSSQQKTSFKSDDSSLNFRRFSLDSGTNKSGNVQNNQQEKVAVSRNSYIAYSNQNCESNRSTKTNNLYSTNYDRLSNGYSHQRPVETKKQVITFSNNRKIITSTPIPRNPPASKSDNLSRNQGTPHIEPSLPRSSDKPNLVAEAQQFSVEAKLRRKKAEAQGRSAVLIQTWERRTQSSDPRGDPSKVSRTQETCLSAMPESHARSRTRGSLDHGRLTDGLLSRARDVNGGQNMPHPVHENRFSAVPSTRSSGDRALVNGISSVQEPEWISLSRKICAKFVEGHSGRTSPASYTHEEPGRVSRTLSSPNPMPRAASTPHLNHTTPTNHSGPARSPAPREVPRVKAVLSAPEDAGRRHSDSDEPPWIHLSRKLCNKFIEEHIEYPPITNGHFVEVPELVEPNGDVRIIEKVGKPKSGKSKQKDRQPEWVSLSKKLRAKFIESHIDDPETIALDNQLNVSDPEETSSTESLADLVREHRSTHLNHKEIYNAHRSAESGFIDNRRKIVRNDAPQFPEQECCWEYQEMEFDQESNSGTFQEAEHLGEPLPEVRARREFLPGDSLDDSQMHRDFGQRFQEVSECYNSDVIFSKQSGEELSSNHKKESHFRPPDRAGRTDCQVRQVSASQDFSRHRHQDLPASNRQDVPASNRQDHPASNRQDLPASNRQDVPASNRQDVPASNRQDVPANNRQSLSTICHQERSANRSQDLSGPCHRDLPISNHRDPRVGSSGDLQQTKTSPSSFQQTKSNFQGTKHITVQFVSPASKSQNRHSVALDCESEVQRIKQSAIHGSFFNLSTWEESHSPKNSLSPKQDFLDKNLRSKSLDNLFDSLDGGLEVNRGCCSKSPRNSSESHSRVSMSETGGKLNEEDETSFEAFVAVSQNAEDSLGVDETVCFDDSSFCDSTSRHESSDGYFENEPSLHQSDGKNESRVYANGDVCNDLRYGSKKSDQEQKRRTSDASYMDRYMETVNEELKNESRTAVIDSGGRDVKQPISKIETSDGERKKISHQQAVCDGSDGDTRACHIRVQNALDVSSKYRDAENKGNGSEITERYSAEYLESELNRNVNRQNSESDDQLRGRKDESVTQDTSSYAKISPRRDTRSKSEENSKELTKNSDQKEKHVKCNGMIPNSIYSGYADDKVNQSVQVGHLGKVSQYSSKQTSDVQNEPRKMGMSKWITISRSEQSVNKVGSSVNKVQRDERRPSEFISDCNGLKLETRCFEKRYSDDATPRESRHRECGGWNGTNGHAPNVENEDGDSLFGPVKEFDLKNRCKSLCDVSFTNSLRDGGSLKHHESVDNVASSASFQFQHFQYDSEIPLCAKLVSSQEKKKKTSRRVYSGTSSVRTDSPSVSETSHVYEDMFKETPSDSEASSWTAVKNHHSYYVNGRSSSMNDLDYSDSCSMSVRCDDASSSENSTLQSRRSSHASASFYVNLRDYDSHMLEPGLKGNSKKGKSSACNGDSAVTSKSSPPTPESLRHLFTSPLSAMHSAPDRTTRLLSRIPSDPQSHYYSTAGVATSSAFKHGFAPEPKPSKAKKTERSSSMKIKDLAQGILLTFKKFQGHSKNSNISPPSGVDVSHLAENNASKTRKNNLDYQDQGRWAENARTDSDSGFLSDVQRTKPRRSSSDITGLARSNPEISEKKKSKVSKKNNKEKGKKSKSKSGEARTIPTVSRKVQQGADGNMYLVTTVSGDTSALPGVYSDSPDTSSEISTHPPVKITGESNC